MIYRKTVSGLVLLMIAAISWPVLADSFVPSHSCTMPVKPDQFNENWEVQMFNDEVSAYKQCIAAFAEEQRQAADVHRRAASDAIDEWNNFVNNNDLN